MLAILSSLNAHSFPIFQPILMILVSKVMVHRALSDKPYLSLRLLSPLMKKVNKHCLLDTPRTVRFSEKPCTVRFRRHHLCIYKIPIREKLSKFSQLSFCQKLFFLNQTPSCIVFNVSTLYRQSINLFHQKLW